MHRSSESEIILLTMLSNIVHNCSQEKGDQTDVILDSLIRIINMHNEEIEPVIRVVDFRKNRNPVNVISAKDARERSTKLHNAEIDSEFAQIMDAINEAINVKAYSITVKGNIKSENRERLLQLSYKLKRVVGINVDANEVIATIQW